MILPSWEEINHRMDKSEEIDPVENFIWEYEESDWYDGNPERWKSDLLKALQYFKENY